MNDVNSRGTDGAYDRHLRDRAAFRCECELPVADLAPSLVFPEARQVFLRDRWSEDATCVTFDAFRWGSAHGHLARNAISVVSHGVPILVDPARLSYEMSDPIGPYGKSTRAHSTVNLNGWNQNTTDVDLFKAFASTGAGAVVSRYSGGYWNAPYGWWFSQGLGHGLAARHTRILYWRHDRLGVVIDEVTRWNEKGRGEEHEEPSLELNWQFSPGEVQFGDNRAWASRDGAGVLLQFPLPAEGMAMTLYNGETEPMRGWIEHPTDNQCATPAPQLCLAAAPMKEFGVTMVSVIVPYAGESLPEATATARAPTAEAPGQCTIVWETGEIDEVFWRAGLETMVGPCGALDTDASILHVTGTGSSPVAAAVIVDGTYLDGCDVQPHYCNG